MTNWLIKAVVKVSLIIIMLLSENNRTYKIYNSSMLLILNSIYILKERQINFLIRIQVFFLPICIFALYKVVNIPSISALFFHITGTFLSQKRLVFTKISLFFDIVIFVRVDTFSDKK